MKLHLTAAFLALAAPAWAQEIDEADREAIAAKVAEFETAMREDMGSMFALMPQRLRATISEQAGLSEAELEAAMRQALDAMMAGATIDDYAMDVDALTAAETPDGSRTYALIPTTTEITIEGTGSFRSASDTLALEDEGEWYLLRVDDPQQAALVAAAYPEFAGVEFQPATMEPME